MSTTTFRRIAAHYIYYRRSLLRNPILSLSSDGTVRGIDFCGEPDRCEGVEFYPGILIPGMVNAHCHLELSHLKGAIAEGGGFAGFAAGLGAVRNGFSAVERADAMRRADEDMFRAGISAVGDVSNDASSFAAKSGSPIHYHTFLELYGLGHDSAGVLAPAAAEAPAKGLEYTITPHSTYSLNKAGFSAAVAGLGNGGSLAEGGSGIAATGLPERILLTGSYQGAGLEGRTSGEAPEGNSGHSRGVGRGNAFQPGGGPLSIHFMETAEESELFRGGGHMAEWYASRGFKTDFLEYGSPAGRIMAQVPSDRDILLIHNCHVTEDIIDRIESHFTGQVTWVLCPGSNNFISRAFPPVHLLRKKGVRIAVGTDSLASNHSLDLVEELKMFSGVPLEELLSWVVDNGAEALGVSGDLGGFDVGKRCGAVLLQGIDWDSMSLTPDSRAVRLV